MLAQELFGLLQGCILGQMPCSHGLTTNAPDYNKLLCHMSFPEPMKATFRLEHRIHEPDDGQRIDFFRFSLLPREVPVTRASDLTAKNQEP
jgi:hypothetical protein